MRDFLKRFNWFAFLCMAALMVVGVCFVYSANYSRESVRLQLLYRSQAELALFGVIAGFALAAASYRRILAWSWLLYLGSIALLVSVLVAGTSQMGAKRWVFGIQPAELAKVATIMLLATFLGREDARRDFIDFIAASAITLLPMALIFLQPDLGTALVFPPILVVMLFVAGTAPKALLTTVLAGVLAIAVVFGSLILRENPRTPAPVRKACHGATCFLSDYQTGRLLDFVFPDRDPLNRGWNRRQSQIAIGSGGVWGKGFLKGDQNILGYLPQQVSANDFIFSVIAEEKGFAGSVFVLLCFGGLLLSVIAVAAGARDGPGRLLCTGVSAMLLCHVFVNVAMTVGMVPVTGLPLPFLSYGRTFMLAVTLSMGLVQSVAVHGGAVEDPTGLK